MPSLSRRRAFTVALGSSTALLISSPAASQESSAGVTASGNAPETIVVTGFRASQRSAVKAKKNASVILDAIAQDDVGRLPDLNIVEASRRITGVSVVGGADATKNRDIYQRATIRGLDPKYNLVTVDDIPLASPDWIYRGARLEMLPASLVARIEAIKTVTAQYDPHALGGQLNLASKSAFANGGVPFFVANVSGGYNDTAGKLVRGGGASIRADATGSRVFGQDDQFGIVASVEYQRLPSTARAELPGNDVGNGWSYYTPAGAATAFPALSTGNLVPVRNQDYFFENMRTRLSGNLKLEWRPSDRAEFSVFGGYYHDQDTETRYESLTIPTGSPTNVTATSGSFAQGNIQQGLTYQPVERNTYLIYAKGRYDLGGKFVLDATAAESKAIYRENRQMIKWGSGVKPGTTSSTFAPNYGYSYVIVDGRPRLTLNNIAAAADPASYVVQYFRNINRNLDSTVDYGKLNLGFNSADDDHGFGFNIGGAITRTNLSYVQQYQEWTAANAAAQNAIGSLAGIIYSQRPTTYETPGVPYLLINRDAAWALFNAKRDQFVATNQIANNAADNFTDLETVKAAYAQALFRTDRFNLQAGVRYDDTGLRIDTNQAPTSAGATAYEPVRRRAAYDFVLPSGLATYDLGNGMRLRAGVSKTIGRPDYSQYAARTSYSIGTDGSLTINTGNPNLKPREGWNYDLSYEWYMRGGSLLSVAGFVKEIKNEIFTSSQAGQTTTLGGVTYTNVTVTTPRNAARARVKGLEFSYSQDALPFVKGLGFNANLTLLDGSFDQPMSAAAIKAGTSATRKTSGLIQQPNYIANVSLFYDVGNFELRGSYNRIGRALQSVDADTPTRDLYAMARQQLDMQARYTLRPGVELVGQVQNVTKEPFVVRQGVDRAYVNYYFPVGRTFWLGLSWKPGR